MRGVAFLFRLTGLVSQADRRRSAARTKPRPTARRLLCEALEARTLLSSAPVAMLGSLSDDAGPDSTSPALSLSLRDAASSSPIGAVNAPADSSAASTATRAAGAYRFASGVAFTPIVSSVARSGLTGSNGVQTLTISGARFAPGAKVRLRSPNVDATVAATFVNSARLQINVVLGNDPSTWTAQVVNPGGAKSRAASFAVKAPKPAIASLSVTGTTADSAAFTVIVKGNTLGRRSVVQWNGSNRATTPVFSSNGRLVTGLQASISAADIASAGTARVTVYSPGPGGGTSAAATLAVRANATQASRVVGYILNSDPHKSDIDYSMLTQVIYASLGVNADGTLGQNITLSQLGVVVSAAHAAGARVSISVGCANSPVFHNIATNPSLLATFSRQVAEFCAQNKLDGVDLDWEGNGKVAANTPNPADYGVIIHALRSRMAPGALLSVAVSATRRDISAASASELDWVAMMGYDLAPGQHAGWTESQQYLNRWATAYGVPRAKLLWGVPFYGKDKSWANCFYGKIIDDAHPAPNLDQVYDPIARDTWYFNGIGTMQRKAQYVLDNGFGGLMIWELGEDHFDSQGRYDQWSLLPAIYSVMASSMHRSAAAASGVA